MLLLWRICRLLWRFRQSQCLLLLRRPSGAPRRRPGHGAGLVRILHYSGAVEVTRSLNVHRITDTWMRPVRRIFFATVCGLATLLAPNLAQADPLRADLDGDGIRDRIESGRDSHELSVRLSRTHQWQRLPAHNLIVKFLVTDVDHDGDPDLVATTRQFGLHVWINKGRGLFETRSHHAAPRRTRLALHHSKPGVRNVRATRFDDSTLNDSNRLFVAKSAPARTHLVILGETSLSADTTLTMCSCRRRAPRGPPTLLVS